MTRRSTLLLVIVALAAGCGSRAVRELPPPPDAQVAPPPAAPGERPEPTTATADAIAARRARLARSMVSGPAGEVTMLAAMGELDQLVRQPGVDSLVAAEVDGENARILKDLLAGHGWAHLEALGHEAWIDAWLVVQHAADPALREQLLAHLEETGQTRSQEYGLLLDRVLVHQGKKQRYGSQGLCRPGGVYEILPIEDAAGVDARRATLGMGPLEGYHARLREECAGPGAGAPP